VSEREFLLVRVYQILFLLEKHEEILMNSPARSTTIRWLQSIAYMLVTATLAPLFPATLMGQMRPDEVIAQSSQLLTETMSQPLAKVPRAMIENAHGVAIIPNVVKGSFIVGARHGKGVLFVREPNGTWHAPVFITLTGGNIGWQVGVQSSDIILVFKTDRSIQGVLNGKLTLGADVAAAAGPVGRSGGVGTDGQLQAEIYTYSRSRGLFAGVSIDGSALQVDRIATGAYYQISSINQTPVVPPAAQQLTETVAKYAEQIVQGNATPASAKAVGATESEVVRGQIVQLAPALFDLLDPQWKEYLGLPAWMFLGGAAPNPEEVKTILGRYESVSKDPRFATLAARPEFQSVLSLLKHYNETLAPTRQALQLPPPPPGGNQPVLPN
ncbi:MAG: lipid-binding SYLF domain-containing protein, partial [Pirellula sp.]